ncbi:MAG: tRNA (N(6)-L-threonylcarbamoyladenosine(37)-C(2))-methylthiotransferase MtaB [bacterium]
MKTFTITTLGCKVNQYDGQLIRENLLSAGWSEPGRPDAHPDLCIINTCAVTGASEGKSRRAVLRTVREHPRATVVVTGCCADLNAQSFAKIPGVAHVIGNEMKKRVHQLIGGTERDAARSIHGFSGHTRAFVKIQDGCDSACSYCVIPLARGRSRSRARAEIIDEATALVENGHVEIVLCGIHLGNYGKDGGEPEALVRLIPELAAIKGLARIRLSSIEPEDVTEELIQLIASGGPLCPHLHVPLQSGDDRMLKAMNRGYRSLDYRRLVDAIRAKIPDASITTDIMVGFPGEDEEAVGNTIEMVKHAMFSRAHIFPYSPRPRTAAWRLGDPVDHETKAQRRASVSEAAHETAMEYRKGFIGRDVEALVQGRCTDGAEDAYGLSREYLRVHIDGAGKEIETGRLCRVRIERVVDDGVAGFTQQLY